MYLIKSIDHELFRSHFNHVIVYSIYDKFCTYTNAISS
jgi:hypothetical protein